MDRLMLVYIFSAFYLLLLGYILGSVGRLKVATYYKSIIVFVAMFFPPVSLAWYIILFRKQNRKNKRDK